MSNLYQFELTLTGTPEEMKKAKAFVIKDGKIDFSLVDSPATGTRQYVSTNESDTDTVIGFDAQFSDMYYWFEAIGEVLKNNKIHLSNMRLRFGESGSRNGGEFWRDENGRVWRTGHTVEEVNKFLNIDPDAPSDILPVTTYDQQVVSQMLLSLKSRTPAPFTPEELTQQVLSRTCNEELLPYLNYTAADIIEWLDAHDVSMEPEALYSNNIQSIEKAYSDSINIVYANGCKATLTGNTTVTEALLVGTFDNIDFVNAGTMAIAIASKLRRIY